MTVIMIESNAYYDYTGWITHLVRRPEPEDKRPPYKRESVIINDFWHKEIVFHRRWDPATMCDPTNSRFQTKGRAVPVEVAQKIARPCKRCWPR